MNADYDHEKSPEGHTALCPSASQNFRDLLMTSDPILRSGKLLPDEIGELWWDLETGTEREAGIMLVLYRDVGSIDWMAVVGLLLPPPYYHDVWKGNAPETFPATKMNKEKIRPMAVHAMITEETVRLRSQKCRASAYQSWKRDPSTINDKSSSPPWSAGKSSRSP